MSSLMSLVGIAALMAVAYLLSENRRAINLRTVLGALAIQIGFGALVLYVPFGQSILESASGTVSNVIQYANDGIAFVFGGLVSDKMFELFGGGGFIFAFRVLPIIIFFSALIAVLYYVGAMQWIIRILGGGLQKVLGTSRTESMSATANIFVGYTEAPLVVKPFISKMTRSELFALMVGGLASVAGTVLAGYAGLGVELKYLIAASFMAAPGGLLMAKMIVPETQKPVDLVDEVVEADEDKPTNVIDAAASGAASGLQLALNVGAMLIAFVGLIAMLNGMIGGIGGWFDNPQLTIQQLLGYVFAPVAWIIGVPAQDIEIVGSLIGQKLILNEFVAYISFVDIKETLSPISQTIVTFALCGFANIASIAILLGGIGSLAPSRRHDIARLGLKAVIAGTLANLMSGAIAGLFVGLSL